MVKEEEILEVSNKGLPCHHQATYTDWSRVSFPRVTSLSFRLSCLAGMTELYDRQHSSSFRTCTTLVMTKLTM